MKNSGAIIVLSIFAFATGCTPGNENSSQAGNNPSKNRAKAATNRANTVLVAHRVTGAKNEHDYPLKSEFVLVKETQITAINRDFDALSARMEALSTTWPDAKSKLQSLCEQAGS